MINVTIISPQDCEYCIEVLGQMATLQKEYPELRVRHVDAWSPEGEALIMKHGIMTSPGILVNDTLLAAGPIPESKLHQAIEEISNQEN